MPQFVALFNRIALSSAKGPQTANFEASLGRSQQSGRECFRGRTAGRPSLVFLQGRDDDLCIPGIGPVNRLGTVPESFLCEAFRKAGALGPLRPCVAVTVKRDTDDAEPLATPVEFLAPVPLVHPGESGKKQAVS